MIDYINSKKNKEDYCYDELLKIVARGSSILSDIFHMKNFIPDVFYKPEELKRYNGVIFDFEYLKKIDFFEEKIRNSVDLRNMDEEFRENNIELLQRFYLIFNNVYKYIRDLEYYFESVNKGIYVQHTLENMLGSKNVRHLICEAVFLYGSMLLIIDRLIPGIIRERIIISFYRYSGQSTIQNISEIVKLFQSTGFLLKENVKPKNYPQQYFERFKFDKELIKMVIGTIKDNDIYDQISAFPSPEHRSHALSNQASMIFVILFFIPDYLEKENSKMREIVDKHFSDNWVISIYMGHHVDILDYWKDYKAATNALNITIFNDTVKSLCTENFEKLNSLLKKLEKFYYEGTINEIYVLDNINQLLSLMREANVILKWYLLQLNTTNKKYQSMIEDKLDKENLISLLMAVSHFEYNLKTMFQKLIDNKEKMWNDDKEGCIYRLKELAEYFAGLKNFGKQTKQEDYQEFFERHLKHIENFSFTNSTSAGRKIVIIKEELEKIKKYHYVEGNLQIKQYIIEIIEYLNHMMRVINIKNKVLVNIAQISDFSYAWVTIQEYSSIMQKLLKKDSNNILYLKSVFLKLASILNFPLIRLFEGNSPDIQSVTNHYSTEIVDFVRNVLQIVPISVFKILEQIIQIYNSNFKEVPIKVIKSEINDYSQLDQRYELAKCVHHISLFTKGILAMEKTFVGIIEVDPKEILEDGIRKELLKLLSSKFHMILDLNPTNPKTDLLAKLNELHKVISSIKRGFIYIQDYINIDGSRIWNEELHRLINCYADYEANKFLNKKLKMENKYNLTKYPIPKPDIPKDANYATFLGRLLKYIVSITSPSVSSFSHIMMTWYNSSNKEIFSLKYFSFIKESIGIEGIQGFIRLIDYQNYHNMFLLSKEYLKITNDKQEMKNLQALAKLINNPLIYDFLDSESIKNNLALFASLSKKHSSLFLSIIITTGHYELLKQFNVHSLRESVESENNFLYSQISNMNRLFLDKLKSQNDVQFENKDNKEDKSDDYLKILSEVFNDFSLCEDVFYVDLSKLEYMVLMLATITFNEINLNYGKDRDYNLVFKKKNPDFSLTYFMNGIKTILYQMGRKNTIMFLSILQTLRKMTVMNVFNLKELKNAGEYRISVPENVFIMENLVREIQSKLNLTNNEIDLSSGNRFRIIFKKE